MHICNPYSCGIRTAHQHHHCRLQYLGTSVISYRKHDDYEHCYEVLVLVRISWNIHRTSTCTVVCCAPPADRAASETQLSQAPRQRACKQSPIRRDVGEWEECNQTAHDEYTLYTVPTVLFVGLRVICY